MDNEIAYNAQFTCKVIKLQAPDGSYVPFEYFNEIEYEGGRYAILRQIEVEGGGPVQEGLVILKVEPDPENPSLESYVGVESQETLQAVVSLFIEKMKAEDAAKKG